MNILRRELRRNLKALIIWSLIISGLMILTLAMFHDVAKQQEAVDQLLKQMPKSLIAAFGLNKISMSDPMGYYATKGYVMVSLFGSIYAVMLAGNMLSKEHQEKTIEFLLSKPVSRTAVVTQKLLAIAINLLIFNLLIALANLLGFMIGQAEVDRKLFMLLTLAPFLLHLIFAGIAFLLSTILRKSRSAVSISLGLVFVLYFLEITASIADKFEGLKYITPFEYVDAVNIITDRGIGLGYLSAMIGVILASVLAAYLIYQRKDILI